MTISVLLTEKIRKFFEKTKKQLNKNLCDKHYKHMYRRLVPPGWVNDAHASLCLQKGLFHALYGMLRHLVRIIYPPNDLQ